MVEASENVEAVAAVGDGVGGRMTLREATERIEVSHRHAKRLKGVVAQDRPEGCFKSAFSGTEIQQPFEG
jgi:hypothetical protein